jgi:hypothetical protein
MASVRLTTKIKTQINIRANDLFIKRITDANGALPKDFWDRIMTEVYDEFYSRYATLDMPTDWFVEVAGISCHINENFIAYQPLIKKYRMPHMEKLFNGTILKIESEQISQLLNNEYTVYKLKIKKLEEERDEFKKSLSNVLNNCNTLTQFLRVWPQGEHLIENLDLEPKNAGRQKKNIEVSKEAISKLNTGLLKQTMLNS